jgi:hypothetical protein
MKKRREREKQGVRADDPMWMVAEHIRPVGGEVACLQESESRRYLISFKRLSVRVRDVRRRIVLRKVLEEPPRANPRAEASAMLG